MIKAIYPGTFDPITFGHIDIVTRAASLFDKILFAVAKSDNKKTLFDVKERVTLAKEVLGDLKNVEVISFDKLFMDFAQENKVNVVVRGLRTVLDADYELRMNAMNRLINPDIEIVFLTPTTNLGFISSSLVKEVANLKGDISSFVPESVVSACEKKFISKV